MTLDDLIANAPRVAHSLRRVGPVRARALIRFETGADPTDTDVRRLLRAIRTTSR